MDPHVGAVIAGALSFCGATLLLFMALHWRAQRDEARAWLDRLLPQASPEGSDPRSERTPILPPEPPRDTIVTPTPRHEPAVDPFSQTLKSRM
jgi:hypothetical protein